MATTSQCKKFISEIAPLVQKYAKKYNILAVSAVIAQACLESAYGTSNKAKHHNYFGLKYRKDRLDCHSGYFSDGSTEEYTKGVHTPISCNWYAFKDMEHGVEGYFQFINTSNYANLKGVADPETYLKNIKKDGYATSSDYVDIVLNVIKKWDLTQYDCKTLKINVHAGHCPDGKGASGVVGLIKESTEARKVKDEVIKLLKEQGHKVYDCTCETKETQANCLKKIVEKCNAHAVDIDVSIHFNSGARDTEGNGKTTGVEVYVYSDKSKAKSAATQVCKEIAKLGYKNRGVKPSCGVYVLRKTKAPAMLIECCFVDDKDDVALYDYQTMAKAIVQGIINV